MKTVYLNDSKISYEQAQSYFEDAALWAKEHCQSYISFSVQDVSDVSYSYDHIAVYHFKDPKDALVFELKYKND